MAVKAFFVVSGFLIFMSYERSTSFTSYARKRIRRIYPAYVTTIILFAIFLVIVSSESIENYFSFAWIKYTISNLVFLNFLQPTLSGVFDSNKLAAVNGALWTLKIEVMFYLSVPIIVFLFRKFSYLPLIILIYCSSVAYAKLFIAAAEYTGTGAYLELGRQLPGQLSYFMAGAALYYFFPLFERHIKYFLAAAIIIITVNSNFPLPLFEPIALAIVVIFFGAFLYAGNFGKYGDFSYGFYILHFPIIQIFLHARSFEENPWYFLALVFLTTTIGAIAMWHLVEKRFLLRDSHYVAANNPRKYSPN